MTVREYIESEGYEEVIIFENPSYDDAFIGVAYDNRAVYDYDKMIEWLMNNESMDYEEAAELVSYNLSFYNGESYPIVIFCRN